MVIHSRRKSASRLVSQVPVHSETVGVAMLWVCTLLAISLCKVTVAVDYCTRVTQHTSDLSGQNLTDIPSNIPMTTTSLWLNNNWLSIIEDNIFQKLHGLQNLALSENYITAPGERAFKGRSELCYLDLGRNQLSLTSFHRSVSTFVPNLQILHLDQATLSEIGTFPEAAFEALKNLRRLSISPVNGLVIGPGFSAMFRVEELIISEGDNLDLHNHTFVPFKYSPLKKLTIFSSGLHSISAGAFGPLLHLAYLNLSLNNQLGFTNAFCSLYGLQGHNMTDIIFHYVNFLHDYQTYQLFVLDKMKASFHRNICVENLDLSNNKIIYITKDYEPSLRFRLCLRSFSLRGHRLMVFSMEYLRFLEYKNVRLCDFQGVNGHSLLSDSRGTSSQSVASDLNIMNISIPLNLRHFDAIQCSYSQPAKFPALVNTAKIEFFSFRALNISGKNLTNNNLWGLEVKLHKGLIQNLHSLARLNLENNKFSNLLSSTYALENLTIFNISFNTINNFKQSERMFLDELGKRSGLSVNLLGNPLSFVCSTAGFVQWLNQTHVNLTDRWKLMCTVNDGTQVSIVQIAAELDDFRVNCISKFWLTFSVAAGCVTLVALAVSVVAWRYRYNIKYWFLTRCKAGPAYEQLVDKHYEFDAFVAYNHNDYQWVCHTLRGNLEDDHRQRLCLHHRDFPVAESIQQNIVNAINSSRKIILVISKKFLECDWGEFEIEMASMRMVQEGVQNVVVAILLEDIPVRQMPRSLVSMWRNVTFLLWTDDPADTAAFWERLAHAVVPAK